MQTRLRGTRARFANAFLSIICRKIGQVKAAMQAWPASPFRFHSENSRKIPERDDALESSRGTKRLTSWTPRPRFNPRRFLGRENPSFVSDRSLAYILLICIRDKNAALRCNLLRIDCVEGRPFFVHGDAAALRSFVTIENNSACERVHTCSLDLRVFDDA
jgi:hypothetical protein